MFNVSELALVGGKKDSQSEIGRIHMNSLTPFSTSNLTFAAKIGDNTFTNKKSTAAGRHQSQRAREQTKQIQMHW